ncbi:MAG: ribosome assembly cofactor RimP [Sphaerochaetaceae bacterium]|jgi:ribosome maturation factor RimP
MSFLGDRSGRSLFYGVMMQNSIREDQLFQQLSRLLHPLKLLVVDVAISSSRGNTHVVVILTNSDHSVGIDEVADAHKLIFPRLALTYGRDELSLEVSTPGLSRSFKDLYEFTLFMGRRCRLYDKAKGYWVEGDILEVSDDTITLKDVRIEDAKELIETYSITHHDIHKAKLASR